jgi:UDP-N-acetylglucosamine 3-dehydrogenase
MEIGLIGCGTVAKEGHLPALKALDGINVAAVADTDFEAAKRLAKRFKVPHCYSDIKSLLNSESIDTVVITTSSTTHAMIAVESAKAGKNIIVEKPLAMNLSEGNLIKQAIKDNGVMLSIIQNYRYFPSVKMSKYILSKGYFGELLSFYGVGQMQYPTSWTSGTWPYHERGVLSDFTPHLVDALLWLMNTRPASVYATGGDFTKSSGFLNYSNMLVELENNVSGFLETSWLANVCDFYIDIKGTGGIIKVDVNRDHYEEICGPQIPIDDAKRFTRYMLQVFKGAVTGSIFDKAMKAYSDVYSDVLRGFKIGKAPIPIDDGIETLSVLDAAYLSIKQKKVIQIKDLLATYNLG